MKKVLFDTACDAAFYPIILVPLLLFLSLTDARAAFAGGLNVQHIAVTIDKTRAGQESKTDEEVWRSGREFGRIAEHAAPNSGLMMIFTPDNCWEIEPANKLARHLRTSVPTGVHVHIVQGHGKTAMQFKGLEYGNEVPFFESRKATKTERKDSTGATIIEYSLPVGKAIASLEVDLKTYFPKRLILRRSDNKSLCTITYRAYETVPFDSSLFKPPAGFRIVELSESDLREHRVDAPQQSTKESAKESHNI